MQYNDSAVTAPVALDLSMQFGNDRMLAINYWVSVRTTEPGSGFSVDCTCTDQLGSQSQYTGGVSPGSIQTALTGMFIVEHGDGQAFDFTIGYSAAGTLELDYLIYVTSAPGAP